MAVHVAPAGVGLVGWVRVRIKLGKELFQCQVVHRHHPGLITVIAGSPVPIAEVVQNSKLNEFLAVSEDAELGFPG